MNETNQQTLPTAVIFDMDGTMSDLNGRSPYGHGQVLCENDLVHEHIAELARMYAKHSPHKVLIVSGRFDTVIKETVNWLVKHGIIFDGIFLRHNEDTREDEIIKAEIYREKIAPFFNVVLAFDDRPKIVRMWRQLGVNVADVGKGVEF